MSPLVDTTKKPDRKNIEYNNVSLGIVDVSRIRLIWTRRQLDDSMGKYSQDESGTTLHETMKKESLNSSVLDYLLNHNYLIPRRWKRYWVLFWGTIYRYNTGGLYIRCLHYDKVLGDWHDFAWPIERNFGKDCPAAYPRPSRQEVLYSEKYRDLRWAII